MKILFLVQHLYPCKTGGVELFHYYLADALGQTNTVTILTACDYSYAKENFKTIKIRARILWFQKPSLVFEHVRIMIRMRNKIDIIHIPYMSRSWLYGCYIPWLSRIFNIPYILSLHGGAMLPWKPKLPHRLLFKHAGSIITVSQTIKNEYEKRSGRQIIVLPPLMPFCKATKKREELRVEYGLGENDKVLLFLGSLKQIKGCDTLLKAFFMLDPKFISEYKLHLLFAGEGVMKDELVSEAKAHKFGSRVHFLGNIPHKDVPDLFTLADFYVIPSRYEATPISLLEAMFNRMPIIGSDIPGITNLISHGRNGLIFKSEASEDLSGQMHSLIRDPELADKLSANAESSLAGHLSFADVVLEHQVIYEQVSQKVR